jgi:hypothetical protein
MLQRDRPVILSEIHGPQLENVSKVKVLEYIEFLEEFGYLCYAIGDDGTASRMDPRRFFSSAQFLKSPVVNVAFKAGLSPSISQNRSTIQRKALSQFRA